MLRKRQRGWFQCWPKSDMQLEMPTGQATRLNLCRYHSIWRWIGTSADRVVRHVGLLQEDVMGECTCGRFSLVGPGEIARWTKPQLGKEGRGEKTLYLV